VFVDKYGGPQQKAFDWFKSITRVRVFFKVWRGLLLLILNVYP
jgi:hypothetical protein